MKEIKKIDSNKLCSIIIIGADKMKKLKLYLDTSIVSNACDDRNFENKRLTLKFVDEIKTGKYEVFISTVMLLEVKKADEETQKRIIEVINDLNAEELLVDDEVQALAKKYIAEGIIPFKYENDALHIAVASVNDLDIIVSWNFDHIVKAKTKREVMGINVFMGYKEIDIYSPLEVVSNV